MSIKFRRHGDVNLHPVEKAEGKIVESGNTWILAEGEAHGSKHILTVERPEDMEVTIDEFGTTFYELMGIGTITHTHDHETIIIAPGTYRQGQERELDHFDESVEREVVD